MPSFVVDLSIFAVGLAVFANIDTYYINKHRRELKTWIDSKFDQIDSRLAYTEEDIERLERKVKRLRKVVGQGDSL